MKEQEKDLLLALCRCDGCIYNFEGREYLVIGGAHSVDRLRCIEKSLPFWEDEIPDSLIKEAVEAALKSRGGRIYAMLTHTCPIKYIPPEVFLSTARKAAERKKHTAVRNQYRLDIDRSTENWLGEI